MVDFLTYNKLEKLPTNLLARCKYINDVYLQTPYGSNLDIVQDMATLEEALVNLATQSEFIFDDSVFDCVTYVETILSILMTSQLAGTADEVMVNLKSIRYNKGLSVFLQRNHFFDADWIIHNNWCIKESNVMHEYFIHNKIACANIDKYSWLLQHKVLQKIINHNHAVDDIAIILKKLNIKFSPIVHEIRYLPLKFILDNWHNVQKHLSNFFIVVIIRPNWNVQEKIGTNINVSHVGIGLQVNGDCMFYHASSEKKMVVKLKLIDYFAYCKQIDTIGGMVFLDIPMLM